MKIIWADSPISTNEVCEKAPKSHNWNNKTIHTLLSRLTAKHVIAYEQRGRMYYYYPIVSQGEAPTLLSSLLSGSEISDADLEKMYHMLDSKLNGGEKD